MTKRPYTQRGRLADVLALIQLLALDPQTHRAESDVTERELGVPSSADGWIALAREHPEFFRVNDEEEHPLSLIARHVQSRIANDPNKRRLPLPIDFIQALLQTAITLHDRQVAAAEWWKTWIPLATALAAALMASATTLFTLWLSGWCKN